jgi:hypothetical protein
VSFLRAINIVNVAVMGTAPRPSAVAYLSRPARSSQAVSVERRSKWADAGTRGGSIVTRP